MCCILHTAPSAGELQYRKVQAPGIFPVPWHHKIPPQTAALFHAVCPAEAAAFCLPPLPAVRPQTAGRAPKYHMPSRTGIRQDRWFFPSGLRLQPQDLLSAGQAPVPGIQWMHKRILNQWQYIFIFPPAWIHPLITKFPICRKICIPASGG